MRNYKNVTREEALSLIVQHKDVFNLRTGLYYTYTFGTGTTVVFPTWVRDLPEDGWIVYE